MNDYELVRTPALPLTELARAIVALGDLVDAWDDATQRCFDALVSVPNNGLTNWDVPSFDDVHAQLVQLFTTFNSAKTCKSYLREVK